MYTQMYKEYDATPASRIVLFTETTYSYCAFSLQRKRDFEARDRSAQNWRFQHHLPHVEIGKCSRNLVTVRSIADSASSS